MPTHIRLSVKIIRQSWLILASQLLLCGQILCAQQTNFRSEAVVWNVRDETPSYVLSQDRLTTPPTTSQTEPGQTDASAKGFDSGNDPTIVKKRITFRNDYNKFANGLVANTSTIQASFPILQEEEFKLNFGFDLPMNYYDVESPITAVFSGVGDMKAQLMGIKPLSKQVTFLAGANLWMPTADQQLLELPALGEFTSVDLGTGKYRLEPLFGAVFFASEKLFLIPLYTQDMSFAGKPDSPTVNRGTARFFVNYSLPKGRYVSSETQLLINYANDNDVDAFQRFELGKAFKNGTVFYIKPGIGIAPGNFNREWGMELGMRFAF